MSKLKKPSHYEQLLEAAARDRIPISVLAELTYRCVHRCRHCYTSGGDTRPDAADELATAAWLDIFDQLAAAGTLFLTLSGGEPLLRADFWELLDEAVRRGFHTRVFTSGYLVDEAAAERLAASGAAGVDVSFYSSDPAVFDAVTRVPGSFARVMAAIERLAAGLPPRLKTPVMRGQRVHPGRDLALRSARGAGPSWWTSCSSCPPAATRNTSSASTATSWPPCWPNAGSSWSRRIRSGGHGHDLLLRGFSFLHRRPGGRVWGCSFQDEPAGDLRRERFLDVWRDSPVLAAFRRLSRAAWTVCRTCALDAVCRRCPAFSGFPHRRHPHRAVGRRSLAGASSWPKPQGESPGHRGHRGHGVGVGDRASSER